MRRKISARSSAASAAIEARPRAAGLESDALIADYNLAYLDFLEHRHEAALEGLARVRDDAAARPAVQAPRLLEPPQQRQAVGDVPVHARRAARVPGPRQRAPRFAVAQHRALRQVEAVEEIALVVEQARQRHAVAGALEQPAPGRGGALRLAVAPQVHQGVGEPDRAAALLPWRAGAPVAGGGAAVGDRRFTGTLQRAQYVAP